MKKSVDNKTISWCSYSNDINAQCNVDGVTYYFAAIGGYDRGGQTVYIITKSGNWTVPRTGKYMIELYGGGCGGMTADMGTTTYTSGGLSCQHYDSINLIAGMSIPVTIGTGGYRQNFGSMLSDNASTGTSFGSYSVSGGGNTIGHGARSITIRAAAGNYGKAGTREMAYYQTTNNYPDGVLGKSYGWGSDRDRTSGDPCSVYLKYLGA